MKPRIARSMSPVEALDLNYVPECDAATSEDWAMATTSSNDFATGLAAYYVPMDLLSAQQPPMATNEVDFTSYYPSVAGSIPPKNAPWMASFARSRSHGAAELTLNQVNVASDTLMNMYNDLPGLSTSPLSVTSSTGLVTPAADSNAIDDFLNSLDYSAWNPSASDSQCNKENALAFLADGNNFDKAPAVAGGSGGLPAHAPLAPSITSSAATDVAEHEPDSHNVAAPYIEASVLSSVRHSSSSRSRANYSLGSKTKPGAAIVLAHSDAADDVDNGDHDHERTAATVKRPRKKRAQRGAAEAAQFAPVVNNAPDPCANDEALARQLQEALGRPKRKRAAVASDDSPAQRPHSIATLRPMKSLPRPRERAVAAPDSDCEMVDNERLYGSTSSSSNTSRPVRPPPRRTAKRAAAVPAPTYDLDTDMEGDNYGASTSRLPDPTDDDDDDDYSFEPESDADDDDFSLGKRKRGSAATSRKRGGTSASGSGVKRFKAVHELDVERPSVGPLAGSKEDPWGKYYASTTEAALEANVDYEADCADCEAGKVETRKLDSQIRHFHETDEHQPLKEGLWGQICILCGETFPRKSSAVRHLKTGGGRCRLTTTVDALNDRLEDWRRVWGSPRLKQARSRRK